MSKYEEALKNLSYDVHRLSKEMGWEMDNKDIEVIKELIKEKADLEAKLAVYEKELMDNEKCFTEKDVESLIKDREETIKFLKQQLADTEAQNKRVLEKLDLIVRSNQELEQQLAEKEEQINMLEEHKFYADNIIQAYADKCKNSHQDKISFAVDILEELADCSNYINSKLDFERGSYVSEKAIRDKIKYLEGKKDE